MEWVRIWALPEPASLLLLRLAVPPVAFDRPHGDAFPDGDGLPRQLLHREPPGRTQTSSPSLMANGRRSTWRGPNLSPLSVGTVDSCRTGWAIQPRGSAMTRLRS